MKPVVSVTETKHYRPDVDGLRAIAVLAVVLFHAFPTVLQGGFVGVDIFFVISGFLISKIIIGEMVAGKFSYFTFYSRRIRRIFPSLFLVLMSCFLAAVLSVVFVGKFVLLTNEFKQLMTHIAGGAGFVSNLVLLKESGYFDSSADTKILLHLWSLGIEEQFYIFWPVALLLIWKTRRNFVHAAMGLLLLSFAANLVMAQTDRVANFYAPFTRFWELLAGAALAAAELKVATSPVLHRLGVKLARVFTPDRVSVIGLGLLLLSILTFNETLNFPGFYAALPTLGAALLLGAGRGALVNRSLLSHPVLVWFGLISYPLYLWHWPLLAVANIVTLNHATLETRAGLVVLSIVLAMLSYLWVEKPLRFGGRNTVKVLGLCFGIAVLGGLSLAGSRLQGIGSRFPELGTWLPVTQFSTERDWREHSCFLQPEDYETGFSASCTERTGKPLLFLWGDSHAAALYPGFKHMQETVSFDMAQYTASACPPYIHPSGDARCADVAQRVMAQIAKDAPDLVVLHGKWGEKYDLPKLQETIAFLRAQHIQRILLIGPVPAWENSLPQSLFVHFLTQGDLPQRMLTGLLEKTAGLDAEMAQAATRLGVQYVSVYQTLCRSGEGCMTRLDNADQTLTALDYGHLTPQAASFFISRNQADIVKQLAP